MQTIRSVGAVSEAVTALQPGDMLGLRGPFGTAWPTEELAGQDVVVVAGGLGLAPLRPSIYHVLANRAQFGKVVLLYGTRSPDEILYRRQLETWRKRLDLQIEVTVDHAGGNWRGHVGVVTRLIPRLASTCRHATALVCGPEVMMRFAGAALHDIGMPQDGDLGIDRTQHEMRGRALRALPVRRHVRLQGRRGGPLRPRAPADGAEGDMMSPRLDTRRAWPSRHGRA